MNPKYVIAYPFGGRPVPVDWHLAVRSLKIPTNSRVTEICRRAHRGADGKWVGSLEDSQTSLVEEALRLDAKYILFIEDDTAPPPDTIMALGQVLDNADEDVMACGGIYTTRTSPPEPLVFMAPGEGCYWNWRLGDVFPCWAMGFGCTMIRMEIFKLMPRPWFRELKTWQEIAEFPGLFPELPGKSDRTGISTDLFFFSRLAKMGYKVLAHGGVLPVHWDAETQIGYYLPKGSPPVRGIKFNGEEYGWTDPALQLT